MHYATRLQAMEQLPRGAKLGSTFGYPADEGYAEIWHAGSARYELKRTFDGWSLLTISN